MALKNVCKSITIKFGYQRLLIGDDNTLGEFGTFAEDDDLSESSKIPELCHTTDYPKFRLRGVRLKIYCCPLSRKYDDLQVADNSA